MPSESTETDKAISHINEDMLAWQHTLESQGVRALSDKQQPLIQIDTTSVGPGKLPPPIPIAEFQPRGQPPFSTTLGACCRGYGLGCQLTSRGFCEFPLADGVFLGEGTTCIPDICPYGACCINTTTGLPAPCCAADTCFNQVLERDCPPEAYHGQGSDCFAIETTGACCYCGEDRCHEDTYINCLLAGCGGWGGCSSVCGTCVCEDGFCHGDGNPCDPGNCIFACSNPLSGCFTGFLHSEEGMDYFFS